MNQIRFTSAALFSFAISVAIPSALFADTKLTICAHPKGYNEYYMEVEIEATIDGVSRPVETSPLQDKCYRIRLSSCSEEVRIEVSSGRTYSGEASCQTEPTPMLIAMRANREEILANAFGNIPKGAAPGFDTARFIEEINLTDTLLAELPKGAARADARLFAALSQQDFSTAQKQANLLAGYLRDASKNEISLAYSSITYVAGFRAMGLEALAPENPLVTTVGATAQPWVVLSPEGKKILQIYQSKRLIGSKLGVWDYETTNVLSKISNQAKQNSGKKSGGNSAILSVPRDLDQDQFSIDEEGRLIFQ